METAAKWSVKHPLVTVWKAPVVLGAPASRTTKMEYWLIVPYGNKI